MTPDPRPAPSETTRPDTAPDTEPSNDGPPGATDYPHAEDPYAEDVVAGRRPGEAVLRGQAAITGAVAVGGAVGALARWVLEALAPVEPGGFPTVTLVINVSGCLLMGVLVVLVTEVREAHPMLRPFLGVGVLGGFTTFSSFAVEAHQLLAGRHLAVAGVYLLSTIAAALIAVVVGLNLTRRLAGLHRKETDA